MKHVVYLVIKQNPNAFHILEEIRKQGYNGTVVSTESLRHMVDEFPEEHHFINLRQVEHMSLQESIYCLFVVDDDKLEPLKNVIREETQSFQNIKGFMYSKKLEDYEGSI